MAEQEATPKRLMSRRQFMTLAGAGAVVGAVLLFATRNKGISGLLKTGSGSQTNQATAGKFITTRTQTGGSSSQSLLARIFGGK